MSLIKNSPFLVCLLILCISCTQQKVAEKPKSAIKPNVILIMADDMGYECLSSNGSLEYETPHLDQLAANGIRFTQCISQPLCTPSRVKIMTGLRNFRNYEHFGYLNPKAKTFGHLMKEAGYSTCVAGKWQLNGFYHDLPGWQDKQRPHQFGFDEYCLWQLTRKRARKDGRFIGERFADPIIEQNGEMLQPGIDAYGPDLFADFVMDFIERKKDSAFFVYYPMVLVHDPFVPTPNTEAWQDSTRRYEMDTTYFTDMMAYTDKVVKRITDKLEVLNIAENTLVIFTADNGTHRSISSETSYGIVQGGKGFTKETGVRVPLIAHWPAKIKEGFVYDGLIEFSDFFPTLAEVVNTKIDTTDGMSFYPLLNGDKDFEGREHVLVHYDPEWGRWEKDQFARNDNYKLYRDGRLFHVKKDPEEEMPLDKDALDQEAAIAFQELSVALKELPLFEQEE